MSKYELTQKEYEDVAGENLSDFPGENLLVENVSCMDAVAYCNARNEKEGLTPVYTIDGQSGQKRGWLSIAYRGGMGICLPGRDGGCGGVDVVL